MLPEDSLCQGKSAERQCSFEVQSVLRYTCSSTHAALSASHFIPGDRAPSGLLIEQVAPSGGN